MKNQTVFGSGIGEKMNRNLWSFSLALLLAAAGVGCGGPELIDRTQPNYMKKSELLSGTWYLKDTIVDVGPNSMVMPIGFNIR